MTVTNRLVLRSNSFQMSILTFTNWRQQRVEHFKKKKSQVTLTADTTAHKICMQFRPRVCYVRKQKLMEMNGKQAESLDQEKKEKRSFFVLLFRHWIAKNFLLCVNLPPVSIMTLWLSSSPFRYRAVAATFTFPFADAHYSNVKEKRLR